MFAVLETPTARKGNQKMKLPWQWGVSKRPGFAASCVFILNS